MSINIEDVKTITLRQDQYLVVQIVGTLSDEQRRRATAHFETLIPKLAGYIVVIDSTIKLSQLSLEIV